MPFRFKRQTTNPRAPLQQDKDRGVNHVRYTEFSAAAYCGFCFELYIASS